MLKTNLFSGAVLISVLFSTQTPAHAGTYWVVKNPGILPMSALVRQSITLDENRYVSIELPEGVRPPRGAVADLAIEPLEDDQEIREATRTETRPVAWHVARLRYNELPSKDDGHGTVVAILDDGVKYMHPALTSQMWVNKGEVPGNRKDDDGNGYVDDVYGYDLVENKGDPQGRISGTHGTFCAGLIAAVPAAPDAAQGLAPGARIMALRIFGGAAELRPAFLSTAVAAIKYATDNGANVISNSWRIYKSWTDYRVTPEKLAMLRDAIEYAAKRNVLFVAAAGNETRELSNSNTDLPYPVGLTGLPSLVGVAASNQRDGLASFTNYGAGYVHVAAPGTDMVSTDGTEGWSSGSGTSYAGPVVAAALARSISAGTPPLEAPKKLRETSDPFQAWRGKVDAGGIVNLVDFLK